MIKVQVKYVLLTLGVLNLICLSTALGQSDIEPFRPNSVSTGMGGSLVVLVRDPSAIYWNPALLAGLRDRSMLIDVKEPFAFDFVGLTQFIPLYGTFGVGASRISTSSKNIDMGTFSWGRKLYKSIAYGTSFNLAVQNNKMFATAGWGLFIGNPHVGALDLRWRHFNKSKFTDLFNFAAVIQNIPLSNRVFDPAIQLGVSYLFPRAGLLFNFGYRVQQNNNASHFGTGFEISSTITLFAGVEKFDLDKLGIGLGYTHDNFIFNFVYSTALDKFLITLSARISPKPHVMAQPHFQRGTRHLKEGNYALATKELKKYLAYDLFESKTDTARLLVRMLEKRMARRQHLIDSLNVEAGKLLVKGERHYLRAALILIKVIKLDENNLKARTRLKSLKPVIEKFINNSLAEGNQHFENGNYQKAQSAFTKVLLFDKKNQSALNHLSEIRDIFTEMSEEAFFRGVGFFQQRDYQAAIRDFEQALEIDKNMEAAKSYINKALKKMAENKKQIDMLLGEGRRLEKMRKYIDAYAKYQAVLKVDPNNTIAREKIVELEPKQRNEQRILFKLTQEKKQKLLSILAKAEDSLKNNNWKSAAELYGRALAFDPNNIKAMNGLREAKVKLKVDSLLTSARTKFASNQLLEAQMDYDKVLQIEPTNQSGRNGFSATKEKMDKLVEDYFNEGINLYSLDRYKEAIEMWNKALQLNPKHKGSLEYKELARERLKALRQIN